MALQHVRIYLKSGAVIEFESDGFWANREGDKAPGAAISILNMGEAPGFDLEYIDLAEVAAITKTNVPSRKMQAF